MQTESLSEQKELLDCAVKTLANLYVTYRQRFVMSIPGGSMFVPRHKDGTYLKLRNTMLYSHLRGKYAVAVFAGARSSRFMSFDVDGGGEEAVRRLLDAMEELGMERKYTHVSLSGKKGYHVDILFDEPVYTTELQKFYGNVLNRAGLDHRAVEFRPTANAAVKLPLSVHGETGNICWYVDRETLEPVKRLDYILEIQPYRREAFMRITASMQRCAGTDAGPITAKSRIPAAFTETLIEPGTRHNAMVYLAVCSRYSGDSEEECRAALLKWYRRQPPGVIQSSEEKVMEDVEEIIAWAYSEKFIQKKRRKAVITEEDVRMILSLKRKSERKILFLLTARCGAGCRQVKQNSIAWQIGMTRVTVVNALKRLEEAGMIRKTRGKTFKLGAGYYKTECCRYEVCRPAARKGGRQVEVALDQLREDFETVFSETIAALK